jgi:hypothetical protein
LAEIDPSDPPAVIVTTFARLDEEFFDALAETGQRGHITGLICAATLSELTSEVLFRATTIHGQPSPAYSQIDISSFLEAGSQELGAGRLLVGGKATPAEVSKAVAHGAGVLTINGHSDGIDVQLGAGAWACPIQDPDYSGEPDAPPRCVQTHHCHRHDVPLSDLERMPTVDPRSINARVLLWMSCHGVIPPNPVLGARWALVRQLQRLRQTGAIVTTTGASFIFPHEVLDDLARPIASGESVGQVLGRLSASSANRGFARELILFGDPAVRAMPQGSPAHPRVVSRNLSSKPPPSADCHIGFLKVITQSCIGESEDCRLARERAYLAATRFDQALKQRTADDSHGEATRRAILEYLPQMPSVLAYLVDYTSMYEVTFEGETLCSACGRSGHSYLARGGFDNEIPRRVITCRVCSLAGDSPADLRLGLKITRDAISIEGELPDAPTSGALFVCSRRHGEDLWRDWPATAGGRLERTISVDPTEWPAGPLRVGFVLIAGTRLATVIGAGRRPG